MLSRETPFVKGKSLLFSWGNLNQLCDKYGIKTFFDFDNRFLRGKGDFSLSDLVETVQIGLQRKENGTLVTVSTDEVNELIEEYMDQGKNLSDLYALIVESIYAALIPKQKPSEGEVKGETNPPSQ